MPLADVHMVRHLIQGQVLLRAVLLHIGQCRPHQVVPGRLDGFLLRSLFLPDRQGVQPGRHQADGFLQLLQVAGLQQVPADAQGNGLPGIFKVPVRGQHRGLDFRVLAAQRRQHGQSVHVRHPDIRNHHIRPEAADQLQSAVPVTGGSAHLASELRPRNHAGKPPDDQAFVVHQNYAVHRFTLLSEGVQRHDLRPALLRRHGAFRHGRNALQQPGFPRVLAHGVLQRAEHGPSVLHAFRGSQQVSRQCRIPQRRHVFRRRQHRKQLDRGVPPP